MPGGSTSCIFERGGRMSEYSKTYEIRWSDLDGNNHVNERAWANAGWKVDAANVSEKWVRLVRG
jgi:hypothetical protein